MSKFAREIKFSQLLLQAVRLGVCSYPAPYELRGIYAGLQSSHIDYFVSLLSSMEYN